MQYESHIDTYDHGGRWSQVLTSHIFRANFITSSHGALLADPYKRTLRVSTSWRKSNQLIVPGPLQLAANPICCFYTHNSTKGTFLKNHTVTSCTDGSAKIVKLGLANPCADLYWVRLALSPESLIC